MNLTNKPDHNNTRFAEAEVWWIQFCLRTQNLGQADRQAGRQTDTGTLWVAAQLKISLGRSTRFCNHDWPDVYTRYYTFLVKRGMNEMNRNLVKRQNCLKVWLNSLQSNLAETGSVEIFETMENITLSQRNIIMKMGDQLWTNNKPKCAISYCLWWK